KQPPAFHAFTKEYVRRLRNKLVLSSACPLGEQTSAIGGHYQRRPWREFVGAHIIRIFLYVCLSWRRVFVVAKHLLRHDLPFSIAAHPDVGFVISGFVLLAKNRFRFVQVIAQNCGVAQNPALRIDHFDGSRVSRRQRSLISDEGLLVHATSFFINNHAVGREVFFERLAISERHCVHNLLRSANQFVLRDRLAAASTTYSTQNNDHHHTQPSPFSHTCCLRNQRRRHKTHPSSRLAH